jgi:hypothetical protein
MKSSRERSKSAVFDEPMGVSATEQSYCRSARWTGGAACHISAISCWLCTGILLCTWLVDLISAMLLYQAGSQRSCCNPVSKSDDVQRGQCVPETHLTPLSNYLMDSPYAGASRGIWTFCRGWGALSGVLQYHAWGWYMGRQHGASSNISSNRLQHLYTSGIKPCSLLCSRRFCGRQLVEAGRCCSYLLELLHEYTCSSRPPGGTFETSKVLMLVHCICEF